VKPRRILVLNSTELYGGAPQLEIAGAPVDAIKFYNAAQDHYFTTRISNEIAILDAGV
jgi:hypothetical protein